MLLVLIASILSALILYLVINPLFVSEQLFVCELKFGEDTCFEQIAPFLEAETNSPFQGWSLL